MNQYVFVFPGQGSQYVGMGKWLFEKYPYFEEKFEEAGRILGVDLINILKNGPKEELVKTEITQPMLFVYEYAAYQILKKEYDIEPVCMAGHSIGEISALACAGVIDFADGVKIVRKRGELMSQAAEGEPSSMLAVEGVSCDVIEKICQETGSVIIANYNSSKQYVLSGGVEPLSKVKEKLAACNASKLVNLKVSAAFHSPYMSKAAEQFGEYLSQYTFHKAEYDVIANANGKPYEDFSDIAHVLSKHIVSSVRWTDIMSYCQEKGCNKVIELGPKHVLSGLFHTDCEELLACTIDEEEKFNNFIQKEKEERQEYIISCMSTIVCTKNSNWDNEQYETGVVQPYKRIEKMVDDVENNEIFPTLDMLRSAYDDLHTALVNKKVENEEVDELLKTIGKW